MKKYFPFLLAILISLGMVACSLESKAEVEDNKELVIAAAASLTDVMEEISQIYKEQNPEVNIKYTFGASGSLMTQIEEGAPVDLFISAAEKQMDLLEEKDRIQTDTRKDLLFNGLVLITPNSSDKEITSFEDIATNSVKKIAIGEPESVPAGEYGTEVLKSLDLIGKVQEKIVYATDVRQILSWVEQGEVDCGIVYKTDALTSDFVSAISEAPNDSHRPITYPVAQVDTSKNLKEGREFLEYLSTEEAKKVFEEYGFILNAD